MITNCLIFSVVTISFMADSNKCASDEIRLSLCYYTVSPVLLCVAILFIYFNVNIKHRCFPFYFVSAFVYTTVIGVREGMNYSTRTYIHILFVNSRAEHAILSNTNSFPCTPRYLCVCVCERKLDAVSIKQRTADGMNVRIYLDCEQQKSAIFMHRISAEVHVSQR